MHLQRTIMLSAVVILAGAAIGFLLVAQQKSSTVEGYVLDSSCAFTKRLDKPISRQCALSCAKAGSQLVILGDDKIIYWPISDAMPATGQNERLLEFAGGRVQAKSKVYERGGSKAIVIEGLQAAPAKK